METGVVESGIIPLLACSSSPVLSTTSPNPFDERLPTVQERFLPEDSEAEGDLADCGDIEVSADTLFVDLLDSSEHNSSISTERSNHTNPFGSPPQLNVQSPSETESASASLNLDTPSSIAAITLSMAHTRESSESRGAVPTTDGKPTAAQPNPRTDVEELIRNLRRLLLPPFGIFQQTAEGKPGLAIPQIEQGKLTAELEFPLPSSFPDPFVLVHAITCALREGFVPTSTTPSSSTSGPAHDVASEHDNHPRQAAQPTSSREEGAGSLRAEDAAKGTRPRECGCECKERMREMELRMRKDARRLNELQRLAKRQAGELSELVGVIGMGGRGWRGEVRSIAAEREREGEREDDRGTGGERDGGRERGKRRGGAEGRHSSTHASSQRKGGKGGASPGPSGKRGVGGKDNKEEREEREEARRELHHGEGEERVREEAERGKLTFLPPARPPSHRPSFPSSFAEGSGLGEEGRERGERGAGRWVWVEEDSKRTEQERAEEDRKKESEEARKKAEKQEQEEREREADGKRRREEEEEKKRGEEEEKRKREERAKMVVFEEMLRAALTEMRERGMLLAPGREDRAEGASSARRGGERWERERKRGVSSEGAEEERGESNEAEGEGYALRLSGGTVEDLLGQLKARWRVT